MPEFRETLRILLVNEPRAYREVLAAVLRIRCPQDTITLGAPADLPHLWNQCAPHLLICSAANPYLEAESLSWIVLYPDGATTSISSVGGRYPTVGELDLAGLLAIIEEICCLPLHPVKSSSFRGSNLNLRAL